MGDTMVKALSILFAVILLAGAVGHIVAPEFYAGFIPEPIPEALANGFAVVVEATIGVGLLIPRYRARAGLAFAVLMLGFMPLHIWDALKAEPAVGSHTAATIRLAVQLLLIAGGVAIFRARPRSGQ
ncbi:MAG: putative membrane protein [Myxococcota bacterium]|jgi:uncharacterized membrane protein